MIKRTYSICLFSYLFRHKKTNDFINILKKNGLLKIVIASPKIKLDIKSNWKPYFKKNLNKKLYFTKYLCKKNDINYLPSRHDDYLKIKKTIQKKKINLGIISGARIIKPEILKLFKYGIINFHPGKIPETSGLDSFYWTIKKRVMPYVTAHFIDRYVDKGKVILEKKIKVFKKDDYKSIDDRIYQNQLYLLKKIINKLKKKELIKSKKVKNYSKNKQLSTKMKKTIYEDFDSWKNEL